MAIGLGKMFGFNILENFNYPYASKTMTEFWRRWHISLSSWFRDYLYIPLGGNRKGKIRTTINLFMVFFTTGLWHGAAINFVFWGLGHGMLLFVEKNLGGKIGAILKNDHIKSVLGHLYTMLSVVVLWIFFRLGMWESLHFLQGIFTLNQGNENAILFINTMLDLRFLISFIVAVIFSLPWWRKIAFLYNANLAPLRYFGLVVLLILSICSLASNSYNPFIYFRF
jgi:alginate O-acetyltransferase complex protein AlgI